MSLLDCYTLCCGAVCFYWRKLFSSVQLNIHDVAESCVVEPMYYGHIGTTHKCPHYQVLLIIQFNLHAKAPFVTITKCISVDYAGVLILRVHINMFHCISVELNNHLNRDKGWSWSPRF